MILRLKFLFAVISLGILVGCGAVLGTTDNNFDTAIPADDLAMAETALMTFFDRLATGRYAEAAPHYGGSYDTLVEWNPDVESSDLATLWRNGCSINGLNCLKVRSHITGVEAGPDKILFNVEFATREGELFVLRPCCGATETEQPSKSVFAIRVARGDDGQFRVIDLPPYKP